MIWGFLLGMIAGAVGYHKVVQYLGHKLLKEKQMEAFRRKKDD